MNKYLIEKLKEGRLKKGLKQSDVTSLTGIKNTTLSNYENGNTEPDMDTFLKLCHLYELDYSELLGEAYGYRISGISIDIKKSDIDMLKKYRSLDPYGQETVNYILDRESTRVTELLQKENRIKELESRPATVIDFQERKDALMRIYSYFHKIASAGVGFYFDDIPTDTIEAPYCENADFIIGVSGDSMEPTYSDGDLVYVEKTQVVTPGEIGIFIVNGECFIKEACEEGLKSHNPKYKLIPGTTHINCIGKVLGKVKTD